ncbi:hypothetical protein FHG64_06000 [Antarcticibacterium flavum]|uniref:Glycoside hydrolase family 32 protein n=1 Tax=Antarcticibacterium flavum TaxID=2058175 RepID=A0A5B7X2Y8_9FLAO|nr:MULTISPECIES: GH32 C-terminal domain-containing protein [Antarcticibacterium]MCM4160951.1 hypothetical protein [Antarcticibacterium sp. W02-3]QCY68993.1 hypothetical protein FHG64_06000 [Antarcticibacterium flavum]
MNHWDQKLRLKLLPLAVLLLLSKQEVKAQYDEKYRPQFHFSPKKGWIGDPDGLVFNDGKYHLFWWGHAVSDDLVHWEELPYPMQGGDGTFSYFSGSVVVDKQNTAGFGEDSFIAVYTRHMPGDSLPETQAISVSNDAINFKYYEGNPVLDINKIFFRDPQVFWYEPEKKWVMVVSLPDVQKIQIYESQNMKDWDYLSEFGYLGAQNSFWECPDLFQLPVDGDVNNSKWVMLIGRGPNRVQYFLGSFNGKEFVADKETEDYLRLGKGLNGEVFANFEGESFESWENSGNAFKLSPVSDSTGALGNLYITSMKNSDQKISTSIDPLMAGGVVADNPQSVERTGSLLSPEFIINKSAINFLISGGKNPSKTSINLVVNGKKVRSTSGDNTDVFKWNGWDVTNLKGEKAQISIEDNTAQEDTQYIAIDHIMFSDVLQNQNLEHALWLDYGTDFYAARTWRDIDNVSDRTVVLGWMGNWDYSRDVPTSWGKGFESVPREISLKKLPQGIRVVQQPVPELKKLRKEILNVKKKSVEGIEEIISPSRNTYEIEAVFSTKSLFDFGFNLLVGESRKLVISYDPRTSNFCLDRTRTTDYLSDEEFLKKFATKMCAPVISNNKEIKLHILVDQASIEIFTNEGEKVFSALTFPGEQQKGIEVFSNGGKTELLELRMWELESIWNKKE